MLIDILFFFQNHWQSNKISKFRGGHLQQRSIVCQCGPSWYMRVQDKFMLASGIPLKSIYVQSSGITGQLWVIWAIQTVQKFSTYHCYCEFLVGFLFARFLPTQLIYRKQIEHFPKSATCLARLFLWGCSKSSSIVGASETGLYPSPSKKSRNMMPNQ